MPYSGSPALPRRPYSSRIARRRTSPVVFTASWTTWKRSTAIARARQHPADGGREDRAHVDGDDLHGVPPGRRGAGQPVRGVISGAAFYLAEQALAAVQVVEAGVPPVRELHRTPRSRSSVRQRGRPRRCSSMPRCATGAGCSSSSWSAASPNAPCAEGQEMPACRAASAGVIPRSATSAPACSSSRRVIVQRGGTCGADSVNVPRGQSPCRALHPPLVQEEVHVLPAGPDIPRPGRHILVHLFGNHPAPWARGGERDPRPDRQPPVRPALGVRHRHAFHPQQHRRRILGRRGLVVFDSHKSGSSGPRPHIRRTGTRH